MATPGEIFYVFTAHILIYACAAEMMEHSRIRIIYVKLINEEVLPKNFRTDDLQFL